LYFDAVIDGHSLATLGIAKSSALVVEVVIFAWSINRIVSSEGSIAITKSFSPPYSSLKSLMPQQV
jgi:hypothetical protein